jgi:hypothetical protein
MVFSKRIEIIFMFLLVGIFMISFGSAFSGLGSGTSGDPFQITNWATLNETHNNLSASYLLMANLSSSTSGYTGIGNNWQPIGDCGGDSCFGGNPNHVFEGSFNGNNNFISNLSINLPSTSYVGLFRFSNGTIFNLGLTSLNVTGYDFVGGLVGQSDGTILNSYSVGNVFSTTILSMGVVGGLVGQSDGTILNSYSVGNVSGWSYVGGLAGINSGEINNSYSIASITSTDSSSSGAGGLVGNSDGLIFNSYSTGKVNGNYASGGLAGAFSSGEFINSYWDNQTSEQSTSGGGIGKTTAQMKNILTFNSTWNISMTSTATNGGYPYLAWQEMNNSYIWLKGPTNPFELTECGNVSSSGYYTLTNNIYTGEGICFNILSDNVTIDLNGFNVTSNNVGESYGVYINGYDYLTLKNGAFTNFGKIDDVPYFLVAGIYLVNSNNNSFANLTLSGGYQGIYLESSLFNNFTNVIIISNLAGITIVSSSFNRFANITLSSNSWTALDLSFSANDNLFTNTSISSNLYGVVFGTNSNDNLFVNLQSFGNSGSELFSPDWGAQTGNRLVFNNLYGKIEFEYLTGDIEGLLKFGSEENIWLGNNWAYVNTTGDIVELNVSANVSLYNLPTTMTSPRIMKEGTVCTDCYNFTNLNAGNVTFNVTSWSNYSIQDISKVTSCGTLDQANIVYTLQNNVSTLGDCFNITEDNITLDLNGHTIEGSTSGIGSFGIYVLGRNNITIKNGFVESFGKDVNNGFGIFLIQTNYSLIRNITLLNNAVGLQLSSAAHNNFDNISSSNGSTGITLASLSCFNNTFTNVSAFSNTNRGVSLLGISNFFYNLDAYNNANYAIRSTNWGGSVDNFIIYNNSYGKVQFNFLSQDIVGTLRFNQNIYLSQNSAFVNISAIPELNISANVTFYNNNFNYQYPFRFLKLLKDGIVCGAAQGCYNLTSWNATNFIVNVSNFGNGNISFGRFVSSTSVTLNRGWNMISLEMNSSSAGDKNISVSRGWNLIGFSSNSSLSSADLVFFNDSGVRFNWSHATTEGKVSENVFIYNNNLKSFELVSNLSAGNSYWIYANESGNVSLVGVGGNSLNQNYNWTDLMFVNSTGFEKNSTDANGAGWVNLSKIYSYNSTNFNLQNINSNSSSSWNGYFVYSLINNLTMLRQD